MTWCIQKFKAAVVLPVGLNAHWSQTVIPLSAEGSQWVTTNFSAILHSKGITEIGRKSGKTLGLETSVTVVTSDSNQCKGSLPVEKFKAHEKKTQLL